MKLFQALSTVQAMQHRKGNPLCCFLAAGFTPLHLKTFFAAELSRLIPERPIEIATGLYGDLTGNLHRLAAAAPEGGVVLMEWPDLDPRLSLRSTARWTNSELQDILATARERASQLQRAVETLAERTVLAISLPTLPLPPLFSAPGWEAGSFELNLRAIVQTFAAAVSRMDQVRILSAQRLDRQSPPAERFDSDAEVRTGFPYRVGHASELAALLAPLLWPPVRKKGLITDLDDTLWRGILGEDGVRGISWHIEHNSQMHAFYQRFLGSLASSGALVAVASKNDPYLVADAFHRTDLAIAPSTFFPVEAHWKPKSQSVARILEAWNIGPEAVVFIDDSPLELAEVKAIWPEIECLQFPTKDSAAIYELTGKLRDLFGKSVLLEEDAIRAESIRRSHDAGNQASAASPAAILEQAEAETTCTFHKFPLDPRALELVNKTNQFNLNGIRHTEASWRKAIEDPNGFQLIASYRDKFGPLGKVAVVAGTCSARRLTIHTWVMSCRAFSRRIEHTCLAELLSRFDPLEIEFEYQRTEKNGPLGEFLAEILGAHPSPHAVLRRDALEERLNTTFKLQETMYG